MISAISRVGRRVHVVQVAIQRIQELPEEVLVEIARPALQRVLESQELIQLVREAPQPRRGLLESLVDDERAALERARGLALLSRARHAVALHRLLHPVPFGQGRVRRFQRVVHGVGHRADALVLVNEGILDLEREREEVLLAAHVRGPFVDHAAGRMDLLRPRLLQIRAQAVHDLAHDPGVLHERDEPLRSQALDQSLLGVQRDPALRHHFLALHGAQVAHLSQGLAHLAREARDLVDFQPFGAALHDPDRQLGDAQELGRVPARLIVQDTTDRGHLLVDERAEGRAEARHGLGLVQVLGSCGSHAALDDPPWR